MFLEKIDCLFSKSFQQFESTLVFWVFSEMQLQALCIEGTVGVPGTELVLGGSSRFLVVCGSVLVPGGLLANSSRFLALCEIKAKIDAQIHP